MDKVKLKIVFSCLLVFSMLYIYKVTFALDEISIAESDISVTTIPENPSEYQDVTVKLESYATDLNKAMIEWRSGSSVVLRGYGKTTYSFKTGGLGSNNAISVLINPSEGSGTISKTISINPSEIDLIWEGVDSYTPPFYKGKSLITPESLIKVIAIPNTNIIKKGKGNISYTWKNGDNTVLDASGYNKDSYVFNNSELNRSEKITVTAQSVDGKYTATKTIEIPIAKPKVLFYKKSPTEGILYDQALNSNSRIEENEATIVVAPYFLGIKGSEEIFTYTWKINGAKIETPAKKTELTVRPATRGGYATIEVIFENLNKLFQEASGLLTLNI